MDKFWIIIVLILVFSSTAVCQQEPIYAHANLNPYWYNTGFAGMSDNHELRFNGRHQQYLFPGMPATFTFSYNGKFGDNGLGVLATYDRIASFQKSDIGLSYARHLKFGQKHHLSIGLLAEYFNYRLILPDQLGLVNPNDVAVAKASDGIDGFDFGAGVVYYNDKFYLGVSAVNLAESDIDLGMIGDQRDISAILYRNYYLMTGYTIRPKGKLYSFQPSLLVRIVKGAPIRPEFHWKTNFDLELGNLFFSVGGRVLNRTDLIGTFGFELDEYAVLALSYEYSVSELQQYGSGSFELTLGANINRKKSTIK